MKTVITSFKWIVFAATVFAATAARATVDAPLPRPLTLDAALAYGAEHNPALLRTSESIREQERLEAARLGFNAVLNDTMLALRQQFHVVLLDREIIAVHEEALRVLEMALQQAQARTSMCCARRFRWPTKNLH